MDKNKWIKINYENTFIIVDIYIYALSNQKNNFTNVMIKLFFFKGFRHFLSVSYIWKPR